MEGDAGTSRLNPPPMPKFRRLGRRRPKNEDTAAAADPTSPEVTAEDSPESEGGADPTSPEVRAEDSPESEGGAEPTSPAVTTEEPAEPEDASEETGPGAAPDEAAAARRPSRLGRGWLAGIAAVLVLCAAAAGAGGYFALRYHHESQAIARNDAAALKAAVDCVSATQAPDTNAMAASEQKIIDCGTDAFRSQALLYTSMLVQAYQAANVHVQVSDMRAAVERNNPDGSVDVLVAVRVKVANDQTQNETGYRLRVKMALAEGQYKIAKLDQVTK
ncbi:Mce protein [Mycobacterium sp. E2497]|uniref:Mce protein n=1 Tax=Mycobacterium sp. E2497 TaxID=1834135 RepID=UPI0008001411|nr:Mce protein [Mycobacterium sp. E2497]OBI12254.1 Mce protein [Mycobacterium sp. E2497]